MLIGLGRDPDHDAHGLAFVPFHAVRQLDDGDAGLVNQFAILGHPVRDRDPVAEIGVRLAFAAEHALDVTGSDMPGVDQDLAGGADRLFLGLRLHAEPDELW